MKVREQNASATYGVLSMKPIGPQPDEPKFDTLTVNAARDGELVSALALRGYDVTCKAVSPAVAEKRKAEWEKKQARRAKAQESA